MKTKTQPAHQSEKGFLTLAGEALHVLGEEIVETKDKVVEAASEKIARLKKTVSKLTHKKNAPVKRVAKKVSKKPVSKKISKTGVKKTAKKVAKKVVRKSGASKK